MEQCGLHQRIALQALLTIGHQDADFHADDDDNYYAAAVDADINADADPDADQARALAFSCLASCSPPPFCPCGFPTLQLLL